VVFLFQICCCICMCHSREVEVDGALSLVGHGSRRGGGKN
jgi:hypothetical protein